MTDKNPLLSFLEKEAEKERQKRKFRTRGTITAKRVSKRGHFVLILKTKKREYKIIFPKFRKNEFNAVMKINPGDNIYVTGEERLRNVFCEGIGIVQKKKGTMPKDNSHQMKLI